MKFSETVVWKLTLALVVVAPWLNPFAGGPTPSTIPWLVSLASCGGLLLLAAFKDGGEGVFSNKPLLGRNWSKGVAWGWVFAGTASSVIALLQYFGEASHFAPWVSQASPGEAFANLRQRNQFATLTNISIAALIWLAATSVLPAWRKWAFPLAAVLLAVGNAATSSRTGLLQLLMLAALCGAWGTWRFPQVRHMLMAAVLAYVLAVVALPVLADVDSSVYSMAARVRAGLPCTSRPVLWSNVLHLIAQKPWLGWGWGELDYAHYLTIYEQPRFCDLLDNAHNLPLHLAVELGVPAAAITCCLFIWWVVRQAPWKEPDATRQMAWAVIAVVLVHSMVEYPLWYGPFQIAVMLCIGFLWRSKSSTCHRAADVLSVRAVVFPVMGAALVAVSFWVAWDYHRISQIYLAPSLRDPAYQQDTLEKIRASRFFSSQVRFAELSVTPLTRENAQWSFDASSALLHFSPEPRIIERVIESATLLGRDQEAVAHLARYRDAFPEDYARWMRTNIKPALAPADNR